VALFIRIFAICAFFGAAGILVMLLASTPGERFTLFAGAVGCAVSGVLLLAAASAVEHLAELPKIEAHLARLATLAARAEERATTKNGGASR
jgi:hypothetical protein